MSRSIGAGRRPCLGTGERGSIQNMTCVAPNPYYLELIKGLPSVLVALAIGGIGVYIAWRQYKVAQAKLKIDLFDKRLVIFHRTWEIMSETVRSGTRARNYGLGNPFSNFMPDARFLFGKEIEDYLQEAVKKWTELWAIEGELDGQGVNRLENIEKRRQLANWFEEEASTRAKHRFGQFLDFEQWK